MSVESAEYLATGVNEIDDQHKELFRIINELLHACNQGKGKEEVNKTIQFLDHYVIQHFETEENAMQKSGYPEYIRHRARHVQFIKNLSDLKKEIELNGVGVNIVIKTNHLVVDWLVNHIRKIYIQLGGYLKKRRSEHGTFRMLKQNQGG